MTAKRSQRVLLPIVKSQKPGTLDLTNNMIAKDEAGLDAGLVLPSDASTETSSYFIRSKFFFRICQSASPSNFERVSAMSFASFAFFVGRSTL